MTDAATDPFAEERIRLREAIARAENDLEAAEEAVREAEEELGEAEDVADDLRQKLNALRADLARVPQPDVDAIEAQRYFAHRDPRQIGLPL